MAEEKRDSAVNRAKGLVSPGHVGGRRHRISDDNPLMQGNLDPVDDPSAPRSAKPANEAVPRRQGAFQRGGTGSVAGRTAASARQQAGSSSTTPPMRPAGPSDVVSQSLGGQRVGVTSDVSAIEARVRARRNRGTRAQNQVQGGRTAASAPVPRPDDGVAAEVTSPVDQGRRQSRLREADASSSDLDGSPFEAEPAQESPRAAVDEAERDRDSRETVEGRRVPERSSERPSRRSVAFGGSPGRAAAEGRQGSKPKPVRKPQAKSRASKSGVQVRDMTRDLYDAVSVMFPEGFSQRRVVEGFLALHTGRLDCIESDPELVEAVRDIMGGDVAMVGVMDEVEALREDVAAIRKALPKIRRYALMGALGSAAALDALAKVHGTESGISVDDLSVLTDDLGRAMDGLDASARDFESEEFERGRQIGRARGRGRSS